MKKLGVREGKIKKEKERQIFHFLVGIATILLLIYYGRGITIAGVFFTIIIGTLLINARFLGKRIGFVKWFEERFEREDALLPGWGSACYATGVLIPLTFIADTNGIAAAIFILALGDGVSTIVGRKGRIKIPYNKQKTVEGSVAFFLSSLIAYLFIGPAIIPLAALAAAVESIDFKIDDNLTIPIACTAFLMVVL